jgi:hypothetical protein
LFPLFPSLTVPVGCSVFPVPTLAVTYVSLNDAVSPAARLPDVIVGVAAADVVPS